jgi:hypothetical protein
MWAGRHSVRGGSWNNNRNNVRCANRNRNIPNNFNDNVGFRVFSHDLTNLAGRSRFRAEARRSLIVEPALPVPG